MDIKELPLKNIPTGVLVDRMIGEGWTATHDGLAQEFVKRWATRFTSTTIVRSVGENTLNLATHFYDIRLRTMHDVPCLLLGGETNLADPLRSFWSHFNSPHHLPFVLTLSQSAYEKAKTMLPAGGCLILSTDQLKSVMSSNESHHQLKQYLHEQIPRRRLIPYNIKLPASGGMFFGREDELSRLREEESVSFAIAGPGRIGKTSLIRNYKRLRLRGHDSNSARRFYISLYGSKLSSDDIARSLAMKIMASKQADRTKAKDLLNFLRYVRYRFNNSVELLLDEVDEVCEGETFQHLGEAAKLGLCRLILGGKGRLLRTMLDRKSPLEGRLELIQLGPLEEEPARALMLQPLADLGFLIEGSEQVLNEVLRLTGALPHLLQMFGKKLAECAIKDKIEVISSELLEKVKDDFFITQLFIKSLRELDDKEARLIGLLLVDGDYKRISEQTVQEIARSENLYFDHKKALNVCIELVANNVLVWNHGSYRLANEGLSFYAHETGYLGTALTEARQALVS